MSRNQRPGLLDPMKTFLPHHRRGPVWAWQGFVVVCVCWALGSFAEILGEVVVLVLVLFWDSLCLFLETCLLTIQSTVD